MGPTANPPSADVSAARYEALVAMRRQLIAEDPSVDQRLPEGLLHLIANSPVSTTEGIQSHGFPPAIIEFAEPIAQALRPVVGSEPDVSPAAPVPAPSAPPPPAAPSAAEVTREWAFASYNASVPPEAVEPLRIDHLSDGRVSLVWSAGSGAFIDRVVRGDEHAPYNPDRAQVVSITSTARAIDDVPFAHAVRHYQVWRHSGPTHEEAAFEQPRLIAAGVAVAPPFDVEVHQDEGAVVGVWNVLEGTRAVNVYRVPIRHALAAGVGSPQFRIHADRQMLRGFEDAAAEAGQEYVYQLIAEAETGGEIHTSVPVTREVRLAQVLQPITDLECTSQGADGALFDLAWTEPSGGAVVVYRTQEAPTPGFDRHAIALSALEDQAGLREEDRVHRPAEREGDRSAMRNVPWPSGWGRAYFTAVVVLADRAFVGNTVRAVRQEAPTRLKVIERVDQALLTFEFPPGAHDVAVYVGARDTPPEVVLSGAPIASISRPQYEAEGGLRLPPHLFPGTSTVYAVALANDGPRTVVSAASSITHDPVRVVRYQIALSMGLGAAARRPTVTLQSEVDYPDSIRIGFVLGFRPDRLPLSVEDSVDQVALVRDIDGEATVMRRFIAQGLKATGFREPGWKADPASWSEIGRQAKKGGYLRLFVDDPQYQNRIALLDPPLKSLRVGGFFGGAF